MKRFAKYFLGIKPAFKYFFGIWLFLCFSAYAELNAQTDAPKLAEKDKPAVLNKALAKVTAALKEYGGDRSEVSSELKKLVDQIDNIRPFGNVAYLQDRATFAAVLLQEMEPYRSDPKVAAALQLFVETITHYNEDQPTVAFDTARAGITSLIDDEKVSLSSNKVDQSLTAFIDKLQTFERGHGTLALQRQTKRLKDSFEALTTAPVDDALKTAVAELLAQIPDKAKPEVTVTNEEVTKSVLARIAAINGGEATSAETDFLKALRKAIITQSGKTAPRLRISLANYGDHRTQFGWNRKCSVSQKLRQECDGQSTCSITIAADGFCGEDPAPTSPKGEKYLLLNYYCISPFADDWETYRQDPNIVPSGAKRLRAKLYTTGEISCTVDPLLTEN